MVASRRCRARWSVEIAEDMAMAFGLEEAKKINLDCIVLESDALNILRVVHRKDINRSCVGLCVRDICELTSNFDYRGVGHVKRGDDADYAASLQQGLQRMMRSDSGRRSEPEGAEVVYIRDNVSIHPAQYMSERISGRLKLIKQGDSLFMTWIPYKGQNTNARLSKRDRDLYTIRLLPFTDVRSIRRHTPALGWQYIIVVLSSGPAKAKPQGQAEAGNMPQILDRIKIKKLCRVVVGHKDVARRQQWTALNWLRKGDAGCGLAFPPLYFYNGGVKEFLATIKQHVSIKSLSSLELPGVITIATPSANASAAVSPTAENQNKAGESQYAANLISENRSRQKQKGNDPARDLSIQVLEKFSLVTKFARDTTSQLFGENSGENFFLNDVKKPSHSQSLPDLRSKISSSELEKVADEVPVHPVPADPMELNKIALVWGKPRQSPLTNEEWISFLDSEGRVVDSKALRKRIFYGGIVHELRDESIFPEQAKKFTKFRERKGLIEKDVVRTDRSFSFYDGDDNPNVDLLYDILLTYSFYNFDLGYCQGMSDYLSPLLFVMEDDSEAFWCFAALMERVGPNFNRDQSGMHAQLFALSKLVELSDSPLHNYFKQNDCLNFFFCFRWILIQFKRELRYEETMRLWEVLWSHHLSEHFHLYVCVAILKRQRNKIIGEQMDFDTLLKFINELSGHIDLDAIIRDAEALCICAGETGAACIPPGTPPSLPVENGMLSSQLEDEVL
ncbi:hypothetical protein KSS87_001488 [Heliosperma pusillum]|nr:hypothetical protein KSS87_001488 [Heliosperma pusillum]